MTDETKRAIQEAIRRYPERRSASIAALRAAQYQLGWLSPEVVEEVGAELDLDPNGLQQLVTFYDMFYDHPVGTYVVGVCNNLSCYLAGADGIFEHLQRKLGIAPDQTTPDGLFTLRTVECLAACGNAPAMMVNEEYYENLTTEEVDRILEDLRRRARDAVLRGEKIGEFEVRMRRVSETGREGERGSGGAGDESAQHSAPGTQNSLGPESSNGGQA